MTATRGLSRDQIAVELDGIRPQVIAVMQREFPNIPRGELENAYGDISCQALERNFQTAGELSSYMHQALRHDALDLARSAGFRTTSTLSTSSGGVAECITTSPELAALAREARDRLYEFIAELDQQDRRLAYLHLDPDHDYPPRQIAAMLNLPKSEVKRTLDRIGIRLRRFTALAAAPGALCAHRRPDLVRWQQTGHCPAALERHCRRCAACRAELRQARQAVRSAILPLIPAGAVPLAAPGAVGHLYQAAVSHPAAQRANDALVRVRKAVPIGGGGGTAALAAKLAVSGVVITAGAALHAAATDHTAKHRHHHPPVVVRARAHIASAPPVITATTPTTTAPATTWNALGLTETGFVGRCC